MRKSASLSPQAGKSLVKFVSVVGLAILSPACASQNLWQGQEVLVEARQQALEQNVEYVSEDNRELKDRFNALERLYVELVQHIRAQEAEISTLSSKLSNVEKDPQVEASVNRMRSEVSGIRAQMKKLENRVFSVEMADVSQPVETASIAVPTGTSQTGADAIASDEAVAATNATAEATPVSNIERNEQAFFGVHLASFRSKDQVATGWSGLARNFSDDLEGLTPLIYVQNQEGIGSFMRLVVGPLTNEQEAEALCSRIKKENEDQYCRVSEYQGEPIG